MGMIKVHLSIEDYKEELQRQSKAILRLQERNEKLAQWIRLVCKRFTLKIPSWL